MATRTGVCVSGCVRAGAVWCTFVVNTQTLSVPLVCASVPETPLCHHRLSLPRSHRPAQARSDGHGPRSLATPRISPCLCPRTPRVKWSVERSWRTCSGFCPAAEALQPSRPSSEISAGSTKTRPRQPQMENTCAARSEMTSMQVTKRTTTEHAKSDEGECVGVTWVPRGTSPVASWHCRRCGKHKSRVKVLFAQTSHQHITWSFLRDSRARH